MHKFNPLSIKSAKVFLYTFSTHSSISLSFFYFSFTCMLIRRHFLQRRFYFSVNIFLYETFRSLSSFTISTEPVSQHRNYFTNSPNYLWFSFLSVIMTLNGPKVK